MQKIISQIFDKVAADIPDLVRVECDLSDEIEIIFERLQDTLEKILNDSLNKNEGLNKDEGLNKNLYNGTSKNLYKNADHALSRDQRNRLLRSCYDEIDRCLLEVSGIAEKKGFEIGVKYMMKLFVECLS